MRRDMGRQPFSEPSIIARIAIALGGLALIGMGITPILHGDFSYENWWGGLAFAPIAVLGGAAILVASIVVRFRKPQENEKGHQHKKRHKHKKVRDADRPQAFYTRWW